MHKELNLYKTDIIDILIRDMIPLKELTRIMKSPDRDLIDKKIAFGDFSSLFFAHTKSKEQVVYSFMKELIPLKDMVLDNELKTAYANQILEDCKSTEDDHLLNMKLKVLSEIVEDNFNAEIKYLLADFKNISTDSERAKLGNQFLKCKVDFLIINYETFAQRAGVFSPHLSS